MTPALCATRTTGLETLVNTSSNAATLASRLSLSVSRRNRQNAVEPAREVSLPMILDMIAQTGNYYYRG